MGQLSRTSRSGRRSPDFDGLQNESRRSQTTRRRDIECVSVPQVAYFSMIPGECFMAVGRSHSRPQRWRSRSFMSMIMCVLRASRYQTYIQVRDTFLSQVQYNSAHAFCTFNRSGVLIRPATLSSASRAFKSWAEWNLFNFAKKLRKWCSPNAILYTNTSWSDTVRGASTKIARCIPLSTILGLTSVLSAR